MGKSWNWMKIAGLVLHVLIGGLMIFASLGKVTGTPPAQVLEMLKKIGLDEQLRLIGFGELITGILLIVPWTASLGVLLASAFWEERSVAHMGLHHDVRTAVSVPGTDLGGRVLEAPRDVQQLLAARKHSPADLMNSRFRRISGHIEPVSQAGDPPRSSVSKPAGNQLQMAGPDGKVNVRRDEPEDDIAVL